MTEVIPLPAEPRERAGKGVARRTRAAGRVPAVIYGGKEPPVMISIEDRLMKKAVYDPGFFTHLFDIELNGQKHRVLPRDVQFDPVKDFPIHVDFLRITADSRITVQVPVGFINTERSPGLKRGGMLNIVRHEIELEVPADAIPETIEIDVTAFDLGDSIHISHVTLPPGTKPTITDRDFTIATVAAPSGVKSAAAEAAEVGESESA